MCVCVSGCVILLGTYNLIQVVGMNKSEASQTAVDGLIILVA